MLYLYQNHQLWGALAHTRYSRAEIPKLHEKIKNVCLNVWEGLLKLK
jgi:hypothetical protein